MFCKNTSLLPCSVLVLAIGLASCAHAKQSEPKPLNPNDARLNFSFRLKAGQEPISLKVRLSDTGAISGLSVYKQSDSQTLQFLPSCEEFPDRVDALWGDSELSKLVEFGDFNFDGFTDIELLQNYIPHLDKRVNCIFLWDNKAGGFKLSPELSNIATNLEVHPENKTLSVHEDWQGGAWEDSTYRWNGDRLELIEQNGLYGDWALPLSADQKCGFQFTCSRLINGKLVSTFKKWICTQQEMESLPDCPGPNAIPPRQRPQP